MTNSTGVSILVLVDLAFESTMFLKTIDQVKCFNPCFSGSCFRMRRDLVANSFFNKFQSLFQWILLSNRKRYWKKRPTMSVSILVLVDLAFEFYRDCVGIPLPEVSILVLVDLAFESVMISDDIITLISFNPCFSGSCFRM